MSRKATWLAMVVFAVLIALYALVSALVPAARGQFVVDLFERGAVKAFGHMAFGGIALALGALQFSNRIRVGKSRLHRRFGIVYVITVAVAGTAGLLMAPFSDGGLTAHYGFGLLAVLWLGTTAMAYQRARSREYEAHREWMIRSYALCLAAVTLRIYLPLSAVAGIPFEKAYPVISWMCWVPNLVAAEWFFVRGPFVPLQAPQPASSSFTNRTATTAATPKAASHSR